MANLYDGCNARPTSRVTAQQPITVTLAVSFVSGSATLGTPQTQCTQTPVAQGQTVNP